MRQVGGVEGEILVTRNTAEIPHNYACTTV